MQIDTGAAVSIITEDVCSSLGLRNALQPCTTRFKTYGGTPLHVTGKIDVLVEYEGQKKTLPVIVVPGRKPCLLGRDWLERLSLNWSDVFSIDAEDKVKHLAKKYSTVFSPGVGLIKGYQAKLVLKEGSLPVFCKSRQMPYALRDMVEAEIRSLENAGVLVPVKTSDWATPLVVVRKAENQVRLCGDYKVTVNPCIKTDHYPLPVVEDLFAALAGGKVFTVLDLTTAYQQLELHRDSRSLLTVNTHLGLFNFVRMPYGISSAPAIFQSVMDELLKGMKGVVSYLDDVLVAGSSVEECAERVEAVLKRFAEHGVRVKQEKCKFFKRSVKYLGHVLDADGVHPCSENVEAIQKVPRPRNASELKAYLGMITFYSKFILHMSTAFKPLYDLLQKNKKWAWTKETERSFQESKTWLTEDNVLTFYDPTKELGLVCDASAYGVGAVLFHKIDEAERPIAYASRTLSKAECAYAHIEREALAVVFAIKKFHKYLYGREFTVYSDHLPLAGLFAHNKPISSLAAARMQRWMLLLSAYRYKWVYRKGTDVANADGLSRLPLPTGEDKSDYVQSFSVVNGVPLSADAISSETKKNKVLQKVLFFTLNGWPAHVSEETLAPYFLRRNELSVDQDCVTWGNRVVVPESLRSEVLQLLHENHPGITRMKTLSRSHVWWPKVSEDIENVVKSCTTCQLTQNAMQQVPLVPWNVATRRWQRVHVDFAYYSQQWFLVLVDAYSKWVDVLWMSSTTATKTVEKLRTVFATFGLPEVLVSDNGPQFLSAEFADFLSANGIVHKKIPPYHPASNGAAERLVQTVRKNLLKQMKDEDQLKTTSNIVWISFCLLTETLPSPTTGKTPSELFLSWTPRTRLSLLHPNLHKRLEHHKEREKMTADDSRGPWKEFEAGDAVRVKGCRPSDPEWLPGRITRIVSTATYTVRINNEERFVHVDDIATATFREPGPTIPLHSPQEKPTSAAVPTSQSSMDMTRAGDPLPPTSERVSPQETTDKTSHVPSTETQGERSLENETDSIPLRRSTRTRRPPERYGVNCEEEEGGGGVSLGGTREVCLPD
ncbi:uncharacterized protein K02A2.6-like [Ornithodoros turicata]|uniref:uncharacterized protein K02A2.6-like n=1 Tax=Ornithodoros turicata TaxID=34597 RepID=UPI003139BC70